MGTGGAANSNWEQWANHVLSELKRLHMSLEDLRQEIHDQTKAWSAADSSMRKEFDQEITAVRRELTDLDKRVTVELSTLRAKAAVIGGAIGTISAAAVSAIIKLFLS